MFCWILLSSQRFFFLDCILQLCQHVCTYVECAHIMFMLMLLYISKTGYSSIIIQMVNKQIQHLGDVNVYHRFRCLNDQSLAAGGVWVDLGGAALLEEACHRGGLGAGISGLCGLLPVLQFSYVIDAILLPVNQKHSRRSTVPVLGTRDSFLWHLFQGYLQIQVQSSEEHHYTVTSRECVLSFGK